MWRSNGAEDVRVAKAVSVLSEEVACSKDPDAEGHEREFARIRCKGVALFGGR